MSILTKIKTQFKKSSANKKKKSSYFTTWRIITISTVSVLLISIFGSFYFVYNKIYLTLNNAHSIFLLNTDMNEESIDGEGYEKAKKGIEEKKNKIILKKDTKNIFNYNLTPTTLTNTSTLVTKKQDEE